MKKIAFIAQVVTLSLALPVLTVLELNHINNNVAEKNTSSYVTTPTEKKSISLDPRAKSKIPLACKLLNGKSNPGLKKDSLCC